MARKHAGGAGEASFAISMLTLFEKSGAERPRRRFKFEIAKIVERDELPGYSLELETPPTKREPNVRMRRRRDGEYSRRQGSGVAHLPSSRPASALPMADRQAPNDESTASLTDVSKLIRRSVTSLATKATAGARPSVLPLRSIKSPSLHGKRGAQGG